MDIPTLVTLTICLQTTAYEYPQLVDELAPLMILMAEFGERVGVSEEKLAAMCLAVWEEYAPQDAPAFAFNN